MREPHYRLPQLLLVVGRPMGLLQTLGGLLAGEHPRRGGAATPAEHVEDGLLELLCGAQARLGGNNRARWWVFNNPLAATAHKTCAERGAGKGGGALKEECVEAEGNEARKKSHSQC